MSRLLRTTTCDGTPGSCRVQLTRNGPSLQASEVHEAPNLQQLETRLYQIHRELLQVHPQDLHKARKLQQDAEITLDVFRAANRGELSINVAHIAHRISQYVKTSFGKIGQFFNHLTHRTATVETATPVELQAALDEAEKQRVIASVRFRKVLPSY
jgi:hypothetical protein